MMKTVTDLENWLKQYFKENNITDKLGKVSAAVGALEVIISSDNSKALSKVQIIDVINKILKGEL